MEGEYKFLQPHSYDDDNLPQPDDNKMFGLNMQLAADRNPQAIYHTLENYNDEKQSQPNDIQGQNTALATSQCFEKPDSNTCDGAPQQQQTANPQESPLNLADLHGKDVLFCPTYTQPAVILRHDVKQESHPHHLTTNYNNMAPDEMYQFNQGHAQFNFGAGGNNLDIQQNMMMHQLPPNHLQASTSQYQQMHVQGLGARINGDSLVQNEHQMHHHQQQVYKQPQAIFNTEEPYHHAYQQSEIRRIEQHYQQQALQARFNDGMVNGTAQPFFESEGVTNKLNEKPKGRRGLCHKSYYNARWGWKLLTEWMVKQRLEVDLINIETSKLCIILSHFYVTVRKRNGENYSSSSMFNVRAMLNSHFKENHPQHIDIVEDVMFRDANATFEKTVRLIQSLQEMTTNQPMSERDLIRIKSSGIFLNKQPNYLQLKVWYDLTCCFGNQTSLRQDVWTLDLLKAMYDTSVGKFYITFTTNEKHAKETRMYATMDPLCPIRTVCRYISKLSPSSAFIFQAVIPKMALDKKVWYGPESLGQVKNSRMMERISKLAHLSKRYSNKSLLCTKKDHVIEYTPFESSCQSGSKCVTVNLKELVKRSCAQEEEYTGEDVMSN